MFREALTDFEWTEWSVAALVLFFVVFVGIVIWAYRRSARKHYEYMSKLPLDRRDNQE
jgi:cbb3-type cytochrome oxidase subunit 3